MKLTLSELFEVIHNRKPTTKEDLEVAKEIAQILKEAGFVKGE